MLSLDIDFKRADDGSLIIRATMTNTGDEAISFSTGSSRLFDVHIETLDGERVWTDGSLAQQAVEHHTLNPDESLSQGSVWEHPDVYADIVERHDESLEEYCEKYGIKDWMDYKGETLVAVMQSLGPENAPTERFEFTVSEDLPKEA